MRYDKSSLHERWRFEVDGMVRGGEPFHGKKLDKKGEFRSLLE